MSSVSIAGDTSGSILLQAPAVSGSTTLTLPSTSMTVIPPEVDQWYLTASTSIFTAEIDLTSNIVRQTKVGTGMTQSSGVFTFPSTGYWLISGQIRFQATSATGYAYCRFSWSNNSGAGYNSGPTPLVNIFGGGAYYASTFATHLLEVTDTSAFRYKFAVGAAASTQVNGSTSELQTMFTFQRVSAL
jgi:hypothetical protein